MDSAVVYIFSQYLVTHGPPERPPIVTTYFFGRVIALSIPHPPKGSLHKEGCCRPPALWEILYGGEVPGDMCGKLRPLATHGDVNKLIMLIF